MPTNGRSSLEDKLNKAGALITHILVDDAARDDPKRRWEEGQEKQIILSRTFHQRSFIESAQKLAENGVCEPDCEENFCFPCGNRRYVLNGGHSYTVNSVSGSSQVSEHKGTLDVFPINMGLAFDLIRETYETKQTRVLLDFIKQHEFGKNVYSLCIEKTERISRNNEGMTLGGSSYRAKQGAIQKYGEDGINTIRLSYRIVFVHYDPEIQDCVRYCRTCIGNGEVEVDTTFSPRKRWTINCPDCKGTGKVPENTYYYGGKEPAPR